MSLNGSGVYNVNSAGQPVVSNTLITAAMFNAFTADIATALSTAIFKDGQQTVTANIPLGGFKLTGVGAATGLTDAATLLSIQNGIGVYVATVGGTANAITLTASPAITAYVAGQSFEFLAASSNTAATTIAVSGLTAIAVRKRQSGGKVALVANDIISGLWYTVKYDGTHFVLEEGRPSSQGADIASAATINLDTATGDYTHLTGTTTCTAITLAQGEERTTVTDGAMQFTNGASLILPTAANIVSAAGDIQIWRGEASSVVRCVNYMRANGTPLGLVGLTTVTIATNDFIPIADVSDSNKIKKGLVSDIVSGLPRSYLAGYGLTNNGVDATNDIDIAVGTARDSTNAQDITLASALTKQLDAAWAVGTNAGGLDTGAIGNNTYHVWAIKRSDTGVVDALFSLSASAPTMPTNYDYKRRIGSIIRAAGAIISFSQNGSHFYRASVLDIDVTNPGTAAVTRTLSVPTGITVDAIINVEGRNITTSGVLYYVSSLAQADEAPTINLTPLHNLGTDVATTTSYGATMYVRTNTSAQIRSRQSGSGASDIFRIATLGWVDQRGRED